MQTFTELKNLKNFCESLDSTPDYREVLNNLADDFEVDGVRFISTEAIDSIQQEELSNDLYVLGCFNAWFLRDVLDMDIDVIEAMQQAEAFEAIGKLIVATGKLEELQQDYAGADGYGHHFNHYDGGEIELTISGTDYLVFDNHQ